ncbi:CopG family transcriptional regulator [Candidatus Omnitrophota bacterium]
MAIEKKRATIYFDPQVHHLLKIKAAEASQSISDFVNKTIREELSKDHGPIKDQETLAYEALLEDLKKIEGM